MSTIFLFYPVEFQSVVRHASKMADQQRFRLDRPIKTLTAAVVTSARYEKADLRDDRFKENRCKHRLIDQQSLLDTYYVSGTRTSTALRTRKNSIRATKIESVIKNSDPLILDIIIYRTDSIGNLFDQTEQILSVIVQSKLFNRLVTSIRSAAPPLFCRSFLNRYLSCILVCRLQRS